MIARVGPLHVTPALPRLCQRIEQNLKGCAAHTELLQALANIAEVPRPARSALRNSTPRDAPQASRKTHRHTPGPAPERRREGTPPVPGVEGSRAACATGLSPVALPSPRACQGRVSATLAVRRGACPTTPPPTVLKRLQQWWWRWPKGGRTGAVIRSGALPPHRSRHRP